MENKLTSSIECLKLDAKYEQDLFFLFNFR